MQANVSGKNTTQRTLKPVLFFLRNAVNNKIPEIIPPNNKPPINPDLRKNTKCGNDTFKSSFVTVAIMPYMIKPIINAELIIIVYSLLFINNSLQ